MVTIREASPADNDKLLRLISLAPMEGRIPLRIDRTPDFFNLIRSRGMTITFVAEEKGRIVGCFSASQSNMIVNGNTEKVYYLADLRIEPAYQGKTVTARLLNKMGDYLREEGADILFCTAAGGNEKVKPLFDGRASLPKFESAGAFRVFQIIPLARRMKPVKFEISETAMNDEVTDLYNRFHKRYQYCPAVTRENNHGNRIIVARENHKVLASLILVDMGFAKQNVLMGLPLSLKIIIFLLRFINRVVPLFNVPAINEPVRILYIRAFAYMEGRGDAFDGLIRHAGNLAYRGKYHYLAVGIHERDSIAQYFVKYLHFTFHSLGFIMSVKENHEKICRIREGTLFEDYSLV